MHSRPNSYQLYDVYSDAAMTDYRAYIVEQDRHFLNVVELDCLCDEAAIQAAKRYTVDHLERYRLHQLTAS